MRTATARLSGLLLVYGPALCIGLLMMFDLMPLAMLRGTGGVWASPGGDLAQNLAGHLALQEGGWDWPPLVAGNLMPPHGVSIAMTDSNPFMSLLAKLLHTVLGWSQPVNLLGLWLAACWTLQPIAAVYALRGLAPSIRWEGTLAASILGVLFPALLFRVGHVNLCAHFVLLGAIGLVARRLRPLTWRDWIAPCLLMTAAVMFHPYLFVFAGALFCAPWLQAAIERRPDVKRSFGCFVASAVFPVVLFFVLSGTLGAGSTGFGYYSMNLFSPVWPAYSALFGSNWPILDATGGQYEGYNYLGAGGLGLLLVTLLLLLWRRPLLRPWRGLLLVLLGLFLLALSSKIYAGHQLLISFGVHLWNQVFGSVQSSGRAFWPVGYALLLAGIATVSARLPRAAAAAILAAACLLQWIDTGRLRAYAQDYYAGADAYPPPLTLRAGARLLSTVPACTASEAANTAAAALGLAAVRAGMQLAYIKLSRPPSWFNCEKVLSDGLELPVQPGELRVFLDLPALPNLRLSALGPATECRKQPGLVACGNGIAPPTGSIANPGPALPLIVLPSRLSGASLTPILGIGWHQDSGGIAWSEGPRSTLLFQSRPGAATLRLTLSGISRRPGGARPVGVSVGTGAVRMIDLPDLTQTTIDLPVSTGVDGVVRIAFDSDHPVPPTDRALPAPVNRASLRLVAVDLLPATP
jgi:hypothetical protein